MNYSGGSVPWLVCHNARLRLQVNLFELDSISDSEREQDESVEHLEGERSVLARRYLDVMRLTGTRVLILR